MSELESMLNGKLYDPVDPELVSLRRKAHKLCFEYNSLGHRMEILGCSTAEMKMSLGC